MTVRSRLLDAIPRCQAETPWQRGKVLKIIIFSSLNYFASGGSSTASTMWMVPFEHFTSAVTTFDLLR
jgi:hypothetical protein